MSDLQNLYQQVILDHAREKHGYGLRAEALRRARTSSTRPAATRSR